MNNDASINKSNTPCTAKFMNIPGEIYKSTRPNRFFKKNNPNAPPISISLREPLFFNANIEIVNNPNEINITTQTTIGLITCAVLVETLKKSHGAANTLWIKNKIPSKTKLFFIKTISLAKINALLLNNYFAEVNERIRELRMWLYKGFLVRTGLY
jgi:hypothetical protein